MENKDLEYILFKRFENGADFFSTPERKIGVGGPFSTMGILMVLNDMEIAKDHEVIRGCVELIISLIRDDGRIKISPKGAIYPCHMAFAAAALCKNGYSDNPKVKMMLEYLLNNRYSDGGWRCNKFLYGRGPETNFSNPGVTLTALDAFRCAGMNDDNYNLDDAVETLLQHWEVKLPIGPCHFGVGNQFMQIEYPFLRYNIFYFAYVLSFYKKAVNDGRYLEVIEILNKKLDDGMIIVERPHHKLSKLEFCKKGKPSIAATKRFNEILSNIKANKDN